MHYKNIIGADETGVGDYLTPLISVAAYIPEHNLQKVIDLKIKDSKKISDNEIIKLYFKLKKLVEFEKSKLTQIGYNILNKNFNAHELKTLVHSNAISKLEKRVKVDQIIIDKFADRKNWNKYINNFQRNSFIIKIPKIKGFITFVEKAESKFLAVAAASIIARAILLFEMQKQNKKWGLNFPFGVNDKVINTAKEFIKIYGRDKLKEIAKLSFKTTNKV